MHNVNLKSQSDSTLDREPPPRSFSEQKKRGYGRQQFQKILQPAVAGIWAYLRENSALLLIVVMPTTLATLYFGFLASNVYVTESTFLIHSQSKPQSSSGIGAILQKSGLGGAGQTSDQSSAVVQYIMSRDALKMLNERLNLMEDWSKWWWVDPLQRFIPFFGRRFEYFYNYYQTRVEVQQGMTDSLLTLKVHAFSPRQSLDINKLLLQDAESLVNKLNDRVRSNTIGYALQNVEEAQRHVKEASTKMSDEAQKVVGENLPLAAKDSQYQLLVLDREFAKAQLASTMSSLQTARDEAQQQDLYLEVVSQPHLPDVAMEPRRLKSIISVFVLCLLLWGVWTLFIAGVKEHQH